MTATVAVGDGDMTVLTNHTGLAVTVDGVSILGVPFRVRATLTSSVGYAVQHPESVYKDATGRFAFPMMLVSVALASESPALPDKVKGINGMLLRKYDKYNSDNTLAIWSGSLTGGVWDANRNYLEVESDSGSSVIVYRNERLVERFQEVYRQFLAAREVDAGGEDLSSEL